MNSDWLPLRSIEPIEIFVTDSSGAPISGMTDLYSSIRRKSDGRWLDFSDNTFKVSGWTSRRQLMAEFDPSLSPGFYRFVFDTSSFVSSDTYVISIEQVPPSVFPRIVVGELRVGGVPDDCVTARKNTDVLI
jgi:hypothetical protein